MKLLNLGCGIKTTDMPGAMNIDWSIYARLKQKKIFNPIIPIFIRGDRLVRYNSLPDNIMVHNLSKGIPFDDNSVEMVYHSHLFEHLDRDIAEKFLIEVKRVLKPDGIHRIVVPDFEKWCRAYINHIQLCDDDSAEDELHDLFIEKLLSQSVRREAYGTNRQKPLRRFIENIVLGDARKRGETHQWMYDRISLKIKLLNSGYKSVHLQDYNKSLCHNWSDYALDTDHDGNQYKPNSLYIEAIK